jgi:signal transduction histidine kinase
MATLFRGHDDMMRVMGPAPRGGEYVEIVLPEKPLREAMWRFSVNILLLSLAISVITATLVYLSLLFLLVGPMRRLTAKMTDFHRDPENPNAIMTPSRRRDELGTAERELAAMQRDLVSMLHQKSHLAALGLAVSKISHDLRNLLASAQLFSDRLTSLPDPNVQRFAPRLMQALERAIAFCQSTLSYGQAKEPPPDRRMVPLEGLFEEVRQTLGLGPEAHILWFGSVERALMVDADPDQLFRALLNIARNAMQALEGRAPNDPGRDQIRFIGRREGAVVVIQISDTGPGLPEKARAHLFEAFQGSSRQGGTGLGLVIAAELIRAHGGEIRLVDGTIGATFRITIPDRAVDIGAHRSERQRA